MLRISGLRILAKRFPSGSFVWPSDLPARLCIVTAGNLFEIQHGQRREFVPGDLVYNPRGARPPLCFGEVGAKTLTIEFNDKRLTGFRRAGLATGNYLSAHSERYVAIAARMAQEMGSYDCCSAMVIEALALELMANLHRAQRAPRPVPAWLRRVHAYASTTFDRNLPLAHYGRVAGVHPVYLTQRFRVAYGESLGSFVRRQRLEWAARQLRTTEKRITDIALECGFSDHAHFSRCFRSATGLTPGSYRRLL